MQKVLLYLKMFCQSQCFGSKKSWQVKSEQCRFVCIAWEMVLIKFGQALVGLFLIEVKVVRCCNCLSILVLYNFITYSRCIVLLFFFCFLFTFIGWYRFLIPNFWTGILGTFLNSKQFNSHSLQTKSMCFCIYYFMPITTREQNQSLCSLVQSLILISVNVLLCL